MVKGVSWCPSTQGREPGPLKSPVVQALICDLYFLCVPSVKVRSTPAALVELKRLNQGNRGVEQERAGAAEEGSQGQHYWPQLSPQEPGSSATAGEPGWVGMQSLP